MKNYVVEEHGKYKGYEYAIVLHNLGHRCAYINVINTPLQYIDYNNLDYIVVHGGLTYSSDNCCGLPQGWWLGWDYAHFGDGKDYEALLSSICETWEDYSIIRKYLVNDNSFKIKSIIYTHEMVLQEIKELIDNMKEKGQLDAH